VTTDQNNKEVIKTQIKSKIFDEECTFLSIEISHME